MSRCLSVWPRCDHRSVSTNQKAATGQEVPRRPHGEEAEWRADRTGENVQMTHFKYVDIAGWAVDRQLDPSLLAPHRPSSHDVEEEGVRCRGDSCHPLPHARQSEHPKETFPASVVSPAHHPGHAHRQGDRWGVGVVIIGYKHHGERKCCLRGAIQVVITTL